jgi:solute carrier family 25 carnitine/acylcarnitine transporter 20/29
VLQILASVSVCVATQGMLSPILANAPINALLFAVEGWSVKELRRRGWRAESLATHVVAGGISGLSQTLLASPSELVKIRLQCQIDEGSTKGVHGPWAMTKQIVQSEGVLALFRGFSLTCARDVPAFAVYFSSYWYVKQLLADAVPWMRAKPTTPRLQVEPDHADSMQADAPLSVFHNLPAATGAGSWRPREMQWPGEEGGMDMVLEHPGERGAWQGGYWDSDDSVERETAPASAWRDHGNSSLAVTPMQTQASSAADAAVTEPSPTRLQHHKAGPIAQLLGGGIAGTASWLLLHPVDVLKSVVQRQTADTPKHMLGPFRAARFHLQQDGPGFFLRGIVPTCLRAFPASAVIFLVYETIRPVLRF